MDECVPCLSEEGEHDILSSLSSRFDRFHDIVAPFDCTESISGLSSNLQSSFLQYFRLLRLVILIGMFMISWLKLVNQII